MKKKKCLKTKKISFQARLKKGYTYIWDINNEKTSNCWLKRKILSKKISEKSLSKIVSFIKSCY